MATVHDHSIERLITAEDVAERLAVSVAWVYRKARLVNDPLPTVNLRGRHVRFYWPDVAKWAGIAPDSTG